jgi:hypothetical protein
VNHVRLTRIGVDGLDDELAAALAAIDNAALDGVPPGTLARTRP